MIRRLILLLLAATTLWGGVYFRRVRKSGPAPRARAGVIHAADASTPETGSLQRRILTPHIVCLLVSAVVLGSAAYLALAESAEVAARSQALPSSDLNAPVHEEVLSTGPQSKYTTVKTDGAPSPAPAPDADELLPSGRRTRSDMNPTIQTPSDGFEAIVCSKPWPCAEAIKVASCESGLDRHSRLDGNWAKNGNNYGLFQINSVHAHKWPDFYQDWMDPVRNTEWAFEIWSNGGWGPWECNPERVSVQRDSDDGATTAPTDSPTDSPSSVDSTTPTPTPVPSPVASVMPTPSESPVVLVSASPTPSPVSTSLPTRTPTP